MDHEKRTSRLEIGAKDFNERPERIKIKIIIILGDRLRNLEAENKRLDDIIKKCDYIIISLNNQIAALERERTEFRRILDLRDSTIAYQASVLNFFSTTCAPIRIEACGNDSRFCSSCAIRGASPRNGYEDQGY